MAEDIPPEALHSKDDKVVDPAAARRAAEERAGRAPVRAARVHDAGEELKAFLLALALAAAAQGAAAQEHVALQLKWKHQFQFAGYYAAVEKGFYRDAGFSVALIEASEGADPIDEVLAGRAQYGVGASDLALRRAQGEPLVVLAVVLQHSPLVLLARGGRTQSVHELAGKRIMLMPYETELYAYLQREGMPRGGMVELRHSFNPDDLIKGKVDAVSGYSTDEPFLLRKAGLPYSVFSPRAAGIDFYGDTLFTSEAQVAKGRARVDAFRRASLRGWEYAMQHPGEIADLIRSRYSDRHSREHLLFEAGGDAPPDAAAAARDRLQQPRALEPHRRGLRRGRHAAARPLARRAWPSTRPATPRT